MDEQQVRAHRGLLAAVMHTAVHDAVTQTGDTLAEALEWIESDELREFSFVWICQHLDLCPLEIRRNLKALAGREVSTNRPSYQSLANRFIDVQDSDVHLLDPRRLKNGTAK